jgi:hypothetical protein
MNSRRFSLAFAFALSLSLVFAFVLSSLMKTGTAAPAPAENSPFKGKAVMITLPSQHSLILENPELRKLGDRLCLVGKGSNECLPGKWTNGQTEWVPMSQVEAIIEFGSVEELKKVYEDYQKKNPAPPPPQAVAH